MHNKSEPWSGTVAAPELEEVLIRGAAALLNVPDIGRSDNLFDYGFDSLKAVRFSISLRELLGFDLPIALILQNPTIAELVAAIMESTRSEARRSGEDLPDDVVDGSL